MNLTQKICAGVGVAALATAALFPYAKSYVDSLPQTLTKEQSAKRFLAIVCPVNKLNRQRLALEAERQKELGTYYYNSDALDLANKRVGALESRIDTLWDSIYQGRENTAKQLKDPKFIWPENVRNDLNVIADIDFEDVGLWNVLKLQNREMNKAEKEQDAKDAEVYLKAASRVRQNLGLPPVGKGCGEK